MNGRIYDATLARFMQADPIVQAPTNTQSYNRYSYVLNNPLSYTDPSGYLFKKLFKAIADIPILNAVVTAVLAFYCQACLVVYNTLSTYALTGSLKSALTSGLSTALMPGGGSVGNVFASAAIGGVASLIQGGKFGHGFVSAGLGAAVGGIARGMSNTISKVVVGSIVGGTVSKITGGKFANGAFSGAFAAALSSSAEEVDSEVQGDMKMAEMIYNDGNGAVEGQEVAGHKLLKIHNDDASGLRAGLFVSDSGDAVLSFAGTDTSSFSGFLTDMKTNFLQALGMESAQYSGAKNLAKRYSSQYSNLRFVGHSLGGGLAAAAAYTTGGRATLFNAAGLNSSTIKGSLYSPKITHYYSGYDGIRVLNSVSPVSVPGRQIGLGHAGAHGMGSMCKRAGTSC
ncbi:RHS repeat-associated core domain-containing protein [Rheinheimera soli]|uniref:RHS repeat-associated core domain-containing protein n=1 Tax=Rheinheimera soli TaxID=443616 RepID=UPI001E4EBDB7|nr:RHS repeat-associated core domain-containing protein [Rheinheimera soli]